MRSLVFLFSLSNRHNWIAAETDGTIFVDDIAVNRLTAEQSVGWRTVARIENMVV